MSNTAEVAPGAYFEYDGDLHGVWLLRAAHLNGGYFEVEKDDALTSFQTSLLAARALGATSKDLAGLTGRSPNTITTHNTTTAARLGGGHANSLIAIQFSNGNYDVKKQTSLQDYGLSKSERAILQSYSLGVTPDDIALERGRSLSTIRTQAKAVLAKTGVKNLVAAGTLYRMSGRVLEEPFIQFRSNPVDHDEACRYPARLHVIDEELETRVYFQGESVERSHFTSIDFNEGKLKANDDFGMPCEYTNVLLLTAAGIGVGEAAKITGIKPSGVSRCLEKLRQEAGVSTTAGAIHRAFESGLLQVAHESEFDARLSAAELDFLLTLAEAEPGMIQKSNDETSAVRGSLFNEKLFVNNANAAVTTGHLLGIL